MITDWEEVNDEDIGHHMCISFIWIISQEADENLEEQECNEWKFVWKLTINGQWFSIKTGDL